MKKEILIEIKKYLEMYQEDILKVEDRKGGEVVRIRCDISEILYEIAKETKDLKGILEKEVGDLYVGLKIADMENFKNKTIKELIEFIETNLYTTNLPAYILTPISYAFINIKNKVKE